nr:MBL fold metallo-hydrolase [Caldimonas tepidiphila]
MRNATGRMTRFWAALGCTLLMAGAQAAGPVQTTQVPGYYRHAVGGFQLTALHDGQLEIDPKLLKNASPQQLQALLSESFRKSPTPTAVNAYLVNTGDKLVLVDTGAGRLFGPTLGRAFANLKAAGHEPAQIDAVLLTHLHGDHVGGLIDEQGGMALPNAEIHVAKKEADFWLNPEVMAKAPKEAQPFFQAAQKAVAPYREAGRLKIFDGEAELLPGVRAVATPGHTPGHTSFLFSSKGEQVLVWGDIIHSAAVQFARPKVTIEFDTDAKTAAATRERVLADTAKRRLLVTGAHLPFPGIGHVRAERGAYTWVPIDFSSMP